MNNLAQLHEISPFLRCIRHEEICVYGNWMDYDHVLTFIEEGNVEFFIDGVNYCLSAGDAIIVPPFTPHLVTTPKSQKITHYVTHFDLFHDPDRVQLRLIGAQQYECTTPLREQLLGSSPIIVKLNESQQSYLKEKLLHLMRISQKQSSVFADLQAKSILIDLLALILQYNEVRSTSKVVTRTNWPIVRNTMEFINLHYSNSALTNNVISEAVGVSENYLCSIFMNMLGITVHTYLLNTRIARAKELILEGKYSMTQIAELTGFSSIHTFSRTFKKIYGHSPKAFAVLQIIHTFIRFYQTVTHLILNLHVYLQDLSVPAFPARKFLLFSFLDETLILLRYIPEFLFHH